MEMNNERAKIIQMQKKTKSIVLGLGFAFFYAGLFIGLASFSQISVICLSLACLIFMGLSIFAKKTLFVCGAFLISLFWFLLFVDQLFGCHFQKIILQPCAFVGLFACGLAAVGGIIEIIKHSSINNKD